MIVGGRPWGKMVNSIFVQSRGHDHVSRHLSPPGWCCLLAFMTSIVEVSGKRGRRGLLSLIPWFSCPKVFLCCKSVHYSLLHDFSFMDGNNTIWSLFKAKHLQMSVFSSLVDVFTFQRCSLGKILKITLHWGHLDPSKMKKLLFFIIYEWSSEWQRFSLAI